MVQTRFSIIAALLLLTACAGGSPGGPDVLQPDAGEADSITPEAADPAEREPTLEERWRAPFAVMSRGTPAPRPERQVIRADRAPSDTSGSAAAPADTGEVRARAPRASAGAAGAEPSEAGERAASRPPVAGEDAQAPASGEAGSAEAGLRTHRVERGETWFGLARRYRVSTSALAAVNPDVDPERLRAGEVVLIPSSETPAPAPAPAQRTHRVVAGDSLWGISRRYGVSIESLRDANRLSDDRLRVGQVLIIP